MRQIIIIIYHIIAIEFRPLLMHGLLCIQQDNYAGSSPLKKYLKELFEVLGILLRLYYQN